MPKGLPARLACLAVLLGTTLAGCAGPDADGDEDDDMAAPRGLKSGTGLQVRSPSFEAGTRIPTKHTGDGADVSPALELGRMPDGTKAIALILDDPDAPTADPFIHWMFWDLPANVTRLDEGTNVSRLGAVVGKNDFDQARYNGPKPPRGDGDHRYYFRVYGLDKTLGHPATAERGDLEKAMQGHILAQGAHMGTYSRD